MLNRGSCHPQIPAKSWGSAGLKILSSSLFPTPHTASCLLFLLLPHSILLISDFVNKSSHSPASTLRNSSYIGLIFLDLASTAEHVAVYDIFVQTQHPSGECMYAFDGDELFYVDLDREETVWDLPEFSKMYAFDAQEAVPYIVSLKNNLRALIQRYNVTQAPSGGFFSSSATRWGGMGGPLVHTQNGTQQHSAGGPSLEWPWAPYYTVEGWCLFSPKRG